MAPLTAIARKRRLESAGMPCVAPDHGGTNAPVLTVLERPNVTAGESTGLLSVCNPDPLSARQRELMDATGLSMEDITPWNAIPWFTAEGELTVTRGAIVLTEVVKVMPNLRAVLLMGKEAKKAWQLVVENLGSEANVFTVFCCPVPGSWGWNNPAKRNEIQRAWRDIADLIS